MKKLLLLGLIFIASICYAEIAKLSRIGPTTKTQTSAPTIETIAAVAGQRNCLNNIDLKIAEAGGVYQLQILLGTTTNYAVLLSTGQSLVREWVDENTICGSVNQAVTLKVTTVTAGAFEINYSGFRY